MTSPKEGGSLLLIDDSKDLPSSPSLESFPEFDGVGVAAESSKDPVLRKLYAMRQRSIAAEKLARQREQQLLEEGKVHERTAVRRERKREKERSKEISALLRLKLGEGENDDAEAEALEMRDGSGLSKLPPTSPKGKDYSKDKVGPRKKVISNMAQLVAKMMFRRHDTAKPLSGRSLVSIGGGGGGGAAGGLGVMGVGGTRKDLTASPLSRSSSVLDLGEVGEDQADDHDITT
jgi:hypothetical protein